jgi:glycosyltransferase involved in cell wall biosynthesis
VNRWRKLDHSFGDLVVALALRDAPEPVAQDAPVISVVIPAYNEEDAIVGVLRELPRELAGYVVEPVVVVDGGTDGTADVARAAGYVTLVHPVNRGQGDAIRTGFAYALARGAEIVMTMDADGQHRPDEMIELVKPIVADEADYVQGSRFLGEYDDAGGARQIGIHGFTRLINLLSGAGITDCTNGFRAVRAESLARMRLEEPRFSAPEIIQEATRQGLRLREVPVHIRSRSHGESKKPRRLGYPLGFLGVIVRTWRR